MEAAAKNGIPQISTFMARRAVMGGIRSGIASAMPQSALGLSQLDNLNNMIIKRRKIAQFYNHKLKNTQNIIIPKVDKYKYHSYQNIVQFFLHLSVFLKIIETK